MSRLPCLLAIAFLVLSCNGCDSQSEEELGTRQVVAPSPEEKDLSLEPSLDQTQGTETENSTRESSLDDRRH